jgi:hypothetical protein
MVLSNTDLSAFQSFLREPGLTGAISNGVACGSMQADRSEVVSLDFSDGRPSISKDVVSCSGPLYDEIEQWTTRFRSYFP